MSAVELELIAGVFFLAMVSELFITYSAYDFPDDDGENRRDAEYIGKEHDGVGHLEHSVCRRLSCRCEADGWRGRCESVADNHENAGADNSAQKLDKALRVVCGRYADAEHDYAENRNSDHYIGPVEQDVNGRVIAFTHYRRVAFRKAPYEDDDTDDDQRPHEPFKYFVEIFHCGFALSLNLLGRILGRVLREYIEQSTS